MQFIRFIILKKFKVCKMNKGKKLLVMIIFYSSAGYSNHSVNDIRVQILWTFKS